MLDAAVAQAIVDRTMSVLNVNVNIMDVHGIVIAAGDKKRIGAFHCAAADAIASGRKQLVTAEQAATMDNVEQGVTQPIVYKGTLIGALGMTGAPETVEKYAELAVLSALLIIEQEEMKQRVYQEQRARESFLFDLFTGRGMEEQALFLQRAALLNYPLGRPQILLVVHLFALDGQVDPIGSYQIKDRLLAALSECRVQGVSPAGCFFQHRLALLCPQRAQAPSRSALEEIAQALRPALQEVAGDALIAVGRPCPTWLEIPGSFSQAQGTLEIALRCGLRGGVIFSQDYLTEYTLLQIPGPSRAHLRGAVLGGILSCRVGQRAMLLQTLRRYYQNDMNAHKTAEDLFIHRNTLNLRLNKVYELTGYAPQKFRDAFLLRMALILCEVEEGESIQ